MGLSQNARGYSIGKYALEIDGIAAGWLYSVEGGHRSGEVVTEKLGQEHHVKKHIAGLKYDEIAITFGAGMSKGFWNRLHDSFRNKVQRLEGIIHMCDFDGNIHRSMEFYQGLVTEIGFPGLDAASKDAAKMTLKIAPEWTRTRKGQGKVNVPDYSLGRGQQKKWSPANFRLNIDGLDEACKKVNKIEPLVVKQKVVDMSVGVWREATREPAGLEVPNLVFTTSEAHSKDLYHWEKNFLVHGMNSDKDEKRGTLEYLTADLKNVLFTVTFDGLGIFKLTPDKMDSGGEQIRRVKAECYIEELKFEYEGGSTWA